MRPRRPGSSASARRFAYVRESSATHSNVGTGYTWDLPGSRVTANWSAEYPPRLAQHG